MCQPLDDSICWLLFLEAMFGTARHFFHKGASSYLARVTFLALQAVFSLDECSLVRESQAKTNI